MMQPLTTAERLARIETLLSEKLIPELASARVELSEIKSKVDADVKELTQLKHKGAGILVGISLATTAIGVTLTSFWKQFIATFS